MSDIKPFSLFGYGEAGLPGELDILFSGESVDDVAQEVIVECRWEANRRLRLTPPRRRFNEARTTFNAEASTADGTLARFAGRKRRRTAPVSNGSSAAATRLKVRGLSPAWLAFPSRKSRRGRTSHRDW